MSPCVYGFQDGLYGNSYFWQDLLIFGKYAGECRIVTSFERDMSEFSNGCGSYTIVQKLGYPSLSMKILFLVHFNTESWVGTWIVYIFQLRESNFVPYVKMGGRLTVKLSELNE